jgi:putative PIN family toxin of toxin-antitoxin system
VLDTNVVLAAHLTDNPRSPTAELVVRWRSGEFIQLYSTATLAELREKMVVKHVDIHIVGRYVADLLFAGERVEVTKDDVKPVIAADPDDDLILACAVKGRADYLVTYDPHLLTLGDEYEGVRICDGLHFLYAVRGDVPPDAEVRDRLIKSPHQRL